jgi:small conductance mechanosensitive channel
VAGQAGVVDGIDLFTTNLDTGDNRRIIVPNGAIFGGVIENQTRHPRRQTSVNAVVSGAADLDTTRTAFEALVKRIASTTPGALTEPAPGVALAEIAPVTWSLSVWANTPQVGAVRQALLREAKRTIDELRLAPPGPAMDVRITSMPTSG